MVFDSQEFDGLVNERYVFASRFACSPFGSGMQHYRVSMVRCDPLRQVSKILRVLFFDLRVEFLQKPNDAVAIARVLETEMDFDTNSW